MLKLCQNSKLYTVIHNVFLKWCYIFIFVVYVSYDIPQMTCFVLLFIGKKISTSDAEISSLKLLEC